MPRHNTPSGLACFKQQSLTSGSYWRSTGVETNLRTDSISTACYGLVALLSNSGMYGVITNDVSDYISLLVRIAHIICTHPFETSSDRFLPHPPQLLPFDRSLYNSCRWNGSRVNCHIRTSLTQVAVKWHGACCDRHSTSRYTRVYPKVSGLSP
jgi:hypothetical protein